MIHWKLNRAIQTGKKAVTRLLVFVMVSTMVFSGWPDIGVLSDLFRPTVAEAAGVAGNFAIFREATAGDALTTANFDHNWDTIVATSSSITLNADATQINLL